MSKNTKKSSKSISASLPFSEHAGLVSALNDPNLLRLFEQMQATIAAQDKTLKELTNHIDNLELALKKALNLHESASLARLRYYGTSSEALGRQASFFDEAETLLLESTEADDTTVIPPATSTNNNAPTKKARGHRQALPMDLERIDIIHEIPEDQRTCPCGTVMQPISEVVTEQLHFVPMQVKVERHIRIVYACHADDTIAPKTAPLPKQPLPKSNASASVLAMVLTSKYMDGLPLHRFSQIMTRHGLQLSRATLARWVIGSAQVLQPLVNLLRDHLHAHPYIHMDETTVQVLKEPDKRAQSTSYMWVQRAGPVGKTVVLYDYHSSRSGSVPVRLLDGYQGYLMTDGYDGYRQAVNTHELKHLVCWAHARRRFVEVKKLHGSKQPTKVDEVIELIKRLYQVEAQMKDAPVERRYQARQEISVPVLAQINTWLETHAHTVLPSSALGGAIAYAIKYWSRLTAYCDNGVLPIDNNPVENAIRPFVVGRKAWLFSDTVAGAHASAVIYSLVQTAKHNQIEPYAWLTKVLQQIPHATTIEDYEALLPWNPVLEELQQRKEALHQK